MEILIKTARVSRLSFRFLWLRLELERNIRTIIKQMQVVKLDTRVNIENDVYC